MRTGGRTGLALVCVCASVCAAASVRVRMGNEVRSMPLEDYVVAALGAESGGFTSAEALKAMAVAARTYAVHHRGRHKGADFCESTHCQKLKLAALDNARLREASAATESEVLWYEGRAAATHYHSHCGGMTAASSELWPDLRVPYLRSQTDTFCLSRSRGDWRTQLPVDKLGGIPRISMRTTSGRVYAMLLNGKRVTVNLPGNRFEVLEAGGLLTFYGTGYGHGVGMCQTGAEERGKAGHSYREILAFYYPGAKPGITAQGFAWKRSGGERADAYAIHEADARELAAAADRAIRLAEQRTGMSLDGRPVLRMYPTVSTYRDATGAPGSTAAHAQGSTIRLQPAPLLRSRPGGLNRTVLHEAIHLTLNQHAHPQLPHWFHEGLTRYLTGEGAPDIQRLVNRHGRAEVLSWVKSGLPARAGAQVQQVRAAHSR